MAINTSWNNVADWYDEMLEGKETYQSRVILPNILRVLELKKGECLLDLACGQGFFSREFEKAGAKVSGADISPRLILCAKENSPKGIDFRVGSADKLDFFESDFFDKVVIILALQNIENISGAISECRRVLKAKGKVYIVLNHPAFRIPKQSEWGWDNEKKVQYRRVDKYMSESRARIDMRPGAKEKETTHAFHRPLQAYFKILGKNGFSITRLEEWISHKESEPGIRKEAEDTARKEIPLFLFLEAEAGA